MRPIPFLTGLILLTACPHFFSLASTVTIEGNLRYVIYRDGKPMPNLPPVKLGNEVIERSGDQRRNFRFSFDGLKWRSITVPTSGEQMKSTARFDTGSDGTNVYQLMVIPDALVRQKQQEREKRFEEKRKVGEKVKEDPRVDDYAVVLSGSVPEFSGDFASILWLAFGSAEYFKTNQSGRIGEFTGKYFWGKITPPPSLKAKWTLQPELPGVPTDLTIFNEGFRYEDRGKGIGQKYPLDPPFDRGYLDAHYEVTAWTNAGEMTLPLEFELTRVQRNPNAKDPTDIIISSVHSAVVTNVQVEHQDMNSDSFVPGIGRVTVSRDKRFQDGTNPIVVTHLLSNRWLTESEVRNSPAHAGAIRTAREKVPPISMATTPVRIAFLLLSAVVLIAPTVYFYKRR